MEAGFSVGLASSRFVPIWKPNLDMEDEVACLISSQLPWALMTPLSRITMRSAAEKNCANVPMPQSCQSDLRGRGLPMRRAEELTGISHQYDCLVELPEHSCRPQQVSKDSILGLAVQSTEHVIQKRYVA